METKAHHVIIGIFVVIMIGFLASSVFWLGKFSDKASYNYYNIDFDEGVSGLGVKSPVVINGISVGKVEKISLHPNNISKVRAVIAVDERIPVRISTNASLSLQGVRWFGIELDTFDDSSELLTAQEGEEFPTISVARSQVSQMLETVPNILRNVNLLIARLDDVIIQNNATVGKSLAAVEKGLNFMIERTDEVDAILKDVRKITENSIKVSKDVTEITTNVAIITADISQQIKPTIAELNKTIAEYRRLAQSLDNIVNAEGNDTAGAVRETLRNISKTAESFARAGQKLENIVAASEPGIKRFTGKGLKDTELLLKEAKETMRSVNRLVRQMETNPQRFLFGDKRTPKYRPN